MATAIGVDTTKSGLTKFWESPNYLPTNNPLFVYLSSQRNDVLATRVYGWAAIMEFLPERQRHSGSVAEVPDVGVEILVGCWHVELDDVGHIGDVQAARSDVGSHQNTAFACGR